MRVYLVRHGVAAPPGAGVDEHRPLTEEGRAAFRASAAIWAAQAPAPTRWIVSPLVRAVQTAEIALGAFGAPGPVEVSDVLVPEGRISAAAQLVDDHFGETLALVGHQPLMGGLAAFLLGRLAFDAQQDYAEAERWFAVYESERPDGPLIREAMGRRLEALARSGDSAGARAQAERYLARFPFGPHARRAREILAE